MIKPVSLLPSKKLIVTTIFASVVGTAIFSGMMLLTHYIITNINLQVDYSKCLGCTQITSNLLFATELTPLKVEVAFLGLLCCGFLLYKEMECKQISPVKTEAE
jgi:hypothetical protein